MKKRILIFLIILTTIYFGCSNNLVSPSLSKASESGQVALKISSDSIPSNVVKVIAILSRSGEDTLTNSVEPISGKTASLNFTNVVVGMWHLKVNADDNNDKVLYSGETDIVIQSNVTTRVNLNLMPVKSSTGSIIITINWGNTNGSWIDYSGNPVFDAVDSNSPFGETSPKILVEDSVLKMWYRQQGASGHSTIGYAVSNNGINWTIPVDHPVLYTGASGEWDSYAVTDGVVLKENNFYKMYYRGTDVHDGYAAIGLAISSDGINWEKYPNPILTPEGPEIAIGPEDIIKINNKYYLYYNMLNNGKLAVGLAFSNDGINWERYKGNPIIFPTLPWEGNGTYFSSIIYENGNFKMVYTNSNENIEAFGKAVSSDGINWEKVGANPFFTSNETASHWASKITYPFLIKYQGKFRVYYNNSRPYDGIYKIGFVESSTF